MRLLRTAVEAMFDVVGLDTSELAPEQASVTIPNPEPALEGPETITVNVEVVGDHLVLYPDRSYKHRALKKALGV